MKVEGVRTQKRQQNKALNSRHTSIPSAQSVEMLVPGAAPQVLPGAGRQPALVCQAGLLALGDSTTQPLPVVCKLALTVLSRPWDSHLVGPGEVVPLL